MKRGGPSHPKVLKLARQLDISRAYAVGILELLWHFTAKYAPAGDIGKYSDEEIAEAVDWRGDPRLLVLALTDARLLDASSPHRVIVHAWAEHAEDATHMSLYRAHQFFADGTAPLPKKIPKDERAVHAPWWQAAVAARGAQLPLEQQPPLYYQWQTEFGSITAPSHPGGSPPVATAVVTALPPPPPSSGPSPSPSREERPRETAAPDRLSEEQRALVRAYVREPTHGAREAIKRERQIEAACLAHARSRGETRADWAAEVCLWAWRECNWARQRQSVPRGVTEGERYDREKRARLEREKRDEIQAWARRSYVGLGEVIAGMRDPPREAPS